MFSMKKFLKSKDGRAPFTSIILLTVMALIAVVIFIVLEARI